MLEIMDSGIVKVNGEEVRLTPVEFKLLAALHEAHGKVRTREDLMVSVFGFKAPVSAATLKSSRAVDMTASRVRKKIPGIDTVRGFGYRLLKGEV
jgi:DNA-binding response OmpR family regulator